jgi:hypothetical protein
MAQGVALDRAPEQEAQDGEGEDPDRLEEQPLDGGTQVGAHRTKLPGRPIREV